MFTTVPQAEQLYPMIDGEISGNRTLIPENSPYWLSQNPFTADGKDLTIEAGTTLKFATNTKLQIGGNLYVNGTEADFVRFTGYSTDTVWHGIEYENNGIVRDPLMINENDQYVSGNIINYAIFEHSQKSLYSPPLVDAYVSNCEFCYNSYGVELTGSSVIVNNYFHNNQATALLISSGNFSIKDNLITYNGQGIYSRGTTTIEHNTITHNTGGGIYQQGGIVTIEYNTITHNTSYNGGGISTWHGEAVIKNNTIAYNTADNFGGGVYAPGGITTLENNTITYNEANAGSAIYINTGDADITQNIITNNIGEYAVWGNPASLTQNNIFYNYDEGSSSSLNLRYTGSQTNQFTNNFWGTRSDQGDIDPSIYDDNESSGSVGQVIYQPILTAPSSETPGQLTNVESVLVTLDGETLNANENGLCDGSTAYICIVGEDGNSFSQDLTEVSVVNLTTQFPLQPLIWETGENTGIYRGEIKISSTIYDPTQNIMKAQVGDILEISSTVDPTKKVLITVIEGGIILPESLEMNEDEILTVDFNEYLQLPEEINYVLNYSNTTNINVAVDGRTVTFTPEVDWNGTEDITFSLQEAGQRLVLTDTITVNVVAVNDTPTVELPEQLEFDVVEDSTMTFTVEAEDIDSELNYNWFINDEAQADTTNGFTYIFSEPGDFVVKSIVSDEEYELETVWAVHVEEGMGAEGLVPTVTALNQNYPNPFNPETTINFSLQEAGDMALEIYNIKGQRVTTLVSSNLEAGKHSVVWNGKDESGRSVVSGIYFYRMRSGKYIETKKMILLK